MQTNKDQISEDNEAKGEKCTGLTNTLFGPRVRHNFVYVSHYPSVLGGPWSTTWMIMWRCKECGYVCTKRATTLQEIALKELKMIE
jgi:rubrerythrin